MVPSSNLVTEEDEEGVVVVAVVVAVEVATGLATALLSGLSHTTQILVEESLVRIKGV